MSDKDPKKSQESWRKYIFKPPKGISLPDLTDTDGPYSLQHPQLDGTIAYLLKEHQESTIWISNFDLSTLRCDICNEHLRSIRALVVHRRKLHFFQGNSVDCAACGTLCHFFAEQISHTLYCPKRESIVIGFCSLCQQQFESHDHFEEHFKKKHAKKQKRPGKLCLFCNKNIWPNKYNNHMRAHHTEIQQDIEKNTPVDQKLWKIVRFQTIPVGVKLPDLNKVFSMYKNPFTTMVPQPDETNAYLTGIGENIWITNFDLAALKCDICALTFNSITPFIVHRRDYHFFPANSKSCTGCALEVFGTFKLSHSLYCPRRRDIIAGYCPMCKTYFHQRGEYMKHIDAKMELNSFKKEQELSECTICGKFVLRLDQHMKWHAFPSPMHECAHCPQQFRLLVKLQEHLAAKHFPSLLKHVCEKCLPQRRFWALHQLHRHEKIVHSDKKVQCRHCEKFYSYNCISRHQKACLWQKKKLGGPTIVKKTPQRKRKDDGGTCHICGKIFRLEASCRAHMYIHLPNEEKPHKCDYCDKRFIAMVAKLEHERDHTGEKPFVCQYCSKAFAKNQTFRDHIRTHTGDGYKCSHCDRMTFDHSSFRKHLKTHEAELGVKLTYTREERRLKRIGLLEELQGTNYL